MTLSPACSQSWQFVTCIPENHMNVRALTCLFCLVLTFEKGLTLDLFFGNKVQLCHCAWKTQKMQTINDWKVCSTTWQQLFGENRFQGKYDK